MNKPGKLKRISVYGGGIVLLLLIIQFFGPSVEKGPVTGRIKAPKEVVEILERACFDCHSNESRLSWYDKLAPASWLVAADIREARSRFNLSTWDSLTPGDQQGRLWEMVNMILTDRMPLASYAVFHPAAKVSPQEIDILKKYVNSINTAKPGDSVLVAAAEREFENFKNMKLSSDSLPMTVNGIGYITGFQKWQVISTTNRFDNETIRVVYGNEIAARALREGHIDPWPEGSTIVKMVWNILEDSNHHIQPGTLNSVQIMTKDDKRFPDTKGWGFAKFNGIKLMPYGATAAFNTTCFNCHKIASPNGYVFNVAHDVFEAGGLEVIGSFANRVQERMYTLYGNDAAKEMALGGNKVLRPGAVFKLVTWKQSGDKYWYGSYINGGLQSVETVEVVADGGGSLRVVYKVLQGEVKGNGPDQQERVKLILDQRPSVYPHVGGE